MPRRGLLTHGIEVKIARPEKRPIQLRYTKDGKQHRVSTGTRDGTEAERQRKELEARLLLGLDDAKTEKRAFGPQIPWLVFVDDFTRRHLHDLREKTQEVYLSNLNVAAKIAKPKTLGDMADRGTLIKLRQDLLRGAESRFDPPRPRSPNSVKSIMQHVLSALSWAEAEGLIEKVPKLPRLRTEKRKRMKGRPLTDAEFQRMLDVVEEVVDVDDVASWKHLLRGLHESALRLGEIMSMKWDDPNFIRPLWESEYPVLRIPAKMQKNATEEDIPLLPGFAAVLEETPPAKREGWCFCPMGRTGRVGLDRAGKVITEIGEAAQIIVEPARGANPAKYASAHDLRRTRAQRLAEAGVPDRVLQRVMRHQSIETTRKYYAPGSVQHEAAVLHKLANGK